MGSASDGGAAQLGQLIGKGHQIPVAEPGDVEPA